VGHLIRTLKLQKLWANPAEPWKDVDVLHTSQAIVCENKQSNELLRLANLSSIHPPKPRLVTYSLNYSEFIHGLLLHICFFCKHALSKWRLVPP
jgi:hypothetical protein